MIILGKAREFEWKGATNSKREFLSVIRYVNLFIVDTSAGKIPLVRTFIIHFRT